MDDKPVFQFIFGEVLATLQVFVATTSQTMATIAGAAGSTMFAIYVIFWGMAILSGKVQEPLMDGFTRIIRGVVILAFATSAGIYSDFIITFFNGVPGAIAAEVARAGSSGGFTMGDNNATAQMLDAALGNGLKAGQKAWSTSVGVFEIASAFIYGLIAICIWVFVAVVCAYAGALVLVANMGLSVMLGLGPIFILCAMFQSTQQLFIAWTRQLITFAVFFIVLAATVTLTFQFFTPFIESLNKPLEGASDVSKIIVNFIKLVCFCAASLLVLVQSTSWASGLAGGASVAAAGAVGRMATAAAGGAVGAALVTARREKNAKTGETEFRGAIPAAARTAQKAASYLRRNQAQKG